MMKKLSLLLPILLAAALVHGQGICLSTQCTPTLAKAGDTATIGGIVLSSNPVAGITFKLVSGPNIPAMVPQQAAFTTSLMAQQNVKLSGLVPGTYVYQLTGTDKAGGVMIGTDSVIVSAAPAPCPAPRTVASIVTTTTYTNGVAATKTVITYADGTTQ